MMRLAAGVSGSALLGTFQRLRAALAAAYGISDVKAAYSLRRAVSIYSGPLIRARRVADNAEQDFFPGADGWLDTAALEAWAAGGDAYVVAWYDQSGLKQHITLTDAQDTSALAVIAGVAVTKDGRPGILFGGEDGTVRTRMQLPFNVFATPHSVVALGARTTTTGSATWGAWLVADLSTACISYGWRSDNLPDLMCNGVGNTSGDGFWPLDTNTVWTWGAEEAYETGNFTTQTYVNGLKSASLTLNFGDRSFLNDVSYIGSSHIDEHFAGTMTELVIVPRVLTDAERAHVERVVSNFDVDPADAADPHRYWRLVSLVSTDKTYLEVAEIELLNDGEDLTTTKGGVPSASSQYNASYSPDYAFDRDPNTFWSTVHSQVGMRWAQWDFGDGNAQVVDQLAITSNPYAERAPRSFLLQYSDDGVTWANAVVRLGIGVWASQDRRPFLLSEQPAGAPSYPVVLPLVNGGFEEGSAVGWGGYYSQNVGVAASGVDVPARTGAYYGVGASSSGSNQWGQLVMLPPEVWADVDAGLVEASASAWVQGYSGDTDRARVMLEAFGAEFTRLSDSCAGSLVDPSAWEEQTVSMWLPPRTRFVKIGAACYRNSGTQLSIYFDDFSDIMLTKRSAPHELLFASMGDTLDGWTVDEGSANTDPGQLYWGWAGIYGDGTEAAISRTEDVPAELIAAVDAGTASLRVRFYMMNYPGQSDLGRFSAQFLDDQGAELAILQTGQRAMDFVSLANGFRWDRVIPAGTRKIKFVNEFRGGSGTTQRNCGALRISAFISTEDEVALKPGDIAKFWRVMPSYSSSNAFSMVTLEMREAPGQPNVAIPDNIATYLDYPWNRYGSLTPDLAFDGNTGTLWGSIDKSYAFVGLEFTEARDIQEIAITARSGEYTQTPEEFIVQASLDGRSWIDVWAVQTTPFADGEIRVFTRPAA